MHISALDLFRIGIGPSSSHTVGPMKAAGTFVDALESGDLLAQTARVECRLYGSLGLTGKGHGSDKAILLGLSGETPESVDPDAIPALLERMLASGSIPLGGRHSIAFAEKTDLLFIRNKRLDFHPNGLRFAAFDLGGALLRETVYFSIGGGFIIEESKTGKAAVSVDVPHPFSNGAELLERCHEKRISISQLMLENDGVLYSEEELRRGLLAVWSAMQGCVARGLRTEGVLPGGLQVPRRARALHQRLLDSDTTTNDPLHTLDWVNLWALAVSEENAAGGRVVTAPTNGAAGILPAVMHYAADILGHASDDAIVRFLLTAAAIGTLYKLNASISGADVGCQGEVGVACSMAAGALAEILGGTVAQVENAAEIGMEHNLGLTCDPVGGLVQIPCIERNAMGAVKAINAARLALNGNGQHCVSLDKVIRTMRETGRDMRSKYKETARGGLAVSFVEC
jgi:L-serine dehydratase